MNVIIAYLETMFSAYPQTPRLLEAKQELQTMMEDAYSDLIAAGHSHNEAVGKVITDFGNLDELAPTLGISAEITPSTSPATTEVTTASPRTPQRPHITLDEAQRFAEARKATQLKLTTAVALFVIAPASMFLTIALAGEPGVALSDQNAGAIGMLPLLVLVAIGVLLIIGRSKDLEEFRHITEQKFTATPQVNTWATSLVRTHQRHRSTALQIAVALWILSATPLFLATLVFPQFGDDGSVMGLVITLCLVAVGLVVFLPSTWAASVGTVLIKAEEEEEEEGSGLFGVIAAVYWPLLVVAFLAWSFIGDAWSQSWVIWPIGAVLFGALSAGAGAWSTYRRKNQ